MGTLENYFSGEFMESNLQQPIPNASVPMGFPMGFPMGSIPMVPEAHPRRNEPDEHRENRRKCGSATVVHTLVGKNVATTHCVLYTVCGRVAMKWLLILPFLTMRKV